ncbi:MAG: hypothetical protein KatS3mg093_039 [Candidatus Parcubacteria bacterium]|nr:MAG: hypothetical protein KatS3mg093_039 [Candidatus Parcubacteria bacterium]
MLLIVGLLLTFVVFFVIILGNINTSSFQTVYVYKNFISLRSLVISGLRYALFQINQDPNFVTSSAQVNMPQGYFIYSVATTNDIFVKKITVQANLTSSGLSKILQATTTINASGTILFLDVSEQ